jgi:hypothetical protein
MELSLKSPQTKPITAREEFSSWIDAENANGLEDIKFCVGNINTAGSSVEQAAKQFLSIINAKKNGHTRTYSDF